MIFEELVKYTESVQDNKEFYYNDKFIVLNKSTCTIDFDNRDQIHIHFENKKALVRTSLNNVLKREVINISEIDVYLKGYEVNITEIFLSVPYLKRVLTD